MTFFHGLSGYDRAGVDAYDPLFVLALLVLYIPEFGPAHIVEPEGGTCLLAFERERDIFQQHVADVAQIPAPAGQLAGIGRGLAYRGFLQTRIVVAYIAV